VPDSSALKAALVSGATLFTAPGVDYGLSPALTLVPTAARATLDERAAALQGCFAVIAGPERYGPELLTRLPDLCLIARSGVGFDQIDVDTASSLGIHVTTTPGQNAQGVAEHAVALLLHLLHRVGHYDQRVRNGTWRDGFFFPEMQGMTVGVIGLGRIGRAFADLVQAFGVQVLAYDVAPVLDPPPHVTMCSNLVQMLPRCQAISLHVPLLPATAGLIGPEELALLPMGSYIVNTARGGIIDEVALAAALSGGRVAGAALDVLEQEPPDPANPLLSMENCVFSPHTASFGRHTIARMTSMIAEQVNDVAAGSTPAGLVNEPVNARFPALVG